MAKVKIIVKVKNKPSDEALQALHQAVYNVITSTTPATTKAS